MLLLKFNKEDFKKCKGVVDVFNTMGISRPDDKDAVKEKCEVNFADEEVFGKRAYYANTFISNDTYNYILDIMKEVPDYQGREKSKNKLSHAAMQWVNYSPISSGPRFEKIKDMVGEINDSVLYIVTPDDEMYKEDPSVGVA